MALRAGIDIGTNTILLLVAEVEGQNLKVIEDHVRVVRLGQGVDKNRAFHPDALDRARACFADYAAVLAKYPGIEVQAAATSGSRDAANSAEFFAEVKEKFGIPVRVISGEEEALLSFRGALPAGADLSRIAVLDIGGGSSEIVGQAEGGQGPRGLFRFSFDMGCVRLSEKFLLSDPASASQIQELRAFVAAELEKQAGILEKVKGKELIGVAGTATYLASSILGLSKFDPEKVDGTIVTLAQVRELIDRFTPLTAAERLGVGGMDKGRADVILAGAFILEAILVRTGLDRFRASVRGLRYGLVLVEPAQLGAAPEGVIYGGFWRRFLATAFDTVLFMIPGLGFSLLPVVSKPIFLAMAFTESLLWLSYSVYFHHQSGQTIGKMMLAIEVKTVNFQPISLQAALLRSSFDFLFSIMTFGGLVIAVGRIDLALLQNRTISDIFLGESSKALSELNPIEALTTYLSLGWILFSIVVLLLNRQKRAPHDFIAGTVVVRKA